MSYKTTGTFVRCARFALHTLWFFVFFSIPILTMSASRAGPPANVQYIHSAINAAHGVNIPINPAAAPTQMANMKYLLCLVDRANKLLGRSTNWCNDPTFATTRMADTNVVNAAVKGYISGTVADESPVRAAGESPLSPFSVTLNNMPAGGNFSFDISATGSFTIDWGDGVIESISRINTTPTTYTHTYAATGNYTLGLSGMATGYASVSSIPAISFRTSVNKAKITAIDGSLGAVFPTLDHPVVDTIGQPRFYWTFHSCDNLTGSIPPNLFSGIRGAPVSNMFNSMFYACKDLTGSIPAGLFSGIGGVPANNMFLSTFYGCVGLSGSIPPGLFGGIIGPPVQNMFNYTFANCNGLSGSIPAGLFGGIIGAPEFGMFDGTFTNCTGLTGSIPGNLFGGIAGAPATGMFSGTFAGCNKLSGIGAGLFDGISGPAQSNMFVSTFFNCTGLIGSSAKSGGQFLYEKWPDATYAQAGSCYTGNTGLTDYCKIPQIWGGDPLFECPPESVFSVTLDNMVSGGKFSFDISAMGTFYVDWGDGTIQTITKASVTNTTYEHTYAASGRYTVGLSGLAKGYNSGANTAAISFANSLNKTKMIAIDGSLGAVFPTLDRPVTGTDGQMRFVETFSGCTGLAGAIPGGLFGGITGAPSTGMFNGTFAGCNKLSGAIPGGLFGGIVGAPTTNIFQNTFNNCGNLTGSIPHDLFGGIHGAPATGMFAGTFAGCNKLSGIGDGLFDGINGATQNNMFRETFANCTGLTGPSAKSGGQFLYEKWPAATVGHVGGCYTDAAGLDDYCKIPEVWGGDPLVECPPDSAFRVTVDDIAAGGKFSFSISAAGTFYVDWGDGGAIQTITKAGVANAAYEHTYSASGRYIVGLAGRATGYGSSASLAAVSFANSVNKTKIIAINGGLGEIFPTLAAPIAGTQGQPRFFETFAGCGGLTGQIPTDLFGGISGAPATGMFNGTFKNCGGLSGAIPAGLFGGIIGAPAADMFRETFFNCGNLTGIGNGLFNGISGTPAAGMFGGTFKNCIGLGGPSAKSDGKFLYEKWPDATVGHAGECYADATGLTDYCKIPEAWGGDPLVKCPEPPAPPVPPTPPLPPAPDTGSETIRENPTLNPFTLKYSSSGKYVSGVASMDDFCKISRVWGSDPLAKCPPESLFFVAISNMDAHSEFSLQISAAGNFRIDWGDGGKIQDIVRKGTAETTYTHTYSAAGNYIVGLSGLATGYSSDAYTAAISFYESANKSKIIAINGSLGAIFPTLENPFSAARGQPRFIRTFGNCSNLAGSIPPGLFNGVKGAPTTGMFQNTFEGCVSLAGPIPAGLFGGIDGAPAQNMFQGTFQNCPSLIGSIPPGLFGGVKGAPAVGMFNGTFEGCVSLTGSIPSDLFKGVVGAPTTGMFQNAFQNCGGLTGPIPPDLFTGIRGAPAQNMFQNTFQYCGGITGPIPPDLFKDIRGEPAAGMFRGTFENCGNLSGPIPDNLFGGIIGAPANNMFNSTFLNCKNLTDTIPDNLFGGIDGAPSNNMFDSTFLNCKNLAGPIPDNLFGGVSGAPAPGMFRNTFQNCGNLSGSIPSDLFGGIIGEPAESMFDQTFRDCNGLTGPIPHDLFKGIVGAPTIGMFAGTFQNCGNLTGSIPSDLFGGIIGVPADRMFSGTFRECSGLTGSIPGNLFGGVWGAPATGMFDSIFWGCMGLSGIGDGLFDGISGVAQDGMFAAAFEGCIGLTGPSAKSDGLFLYDKWQKVTETHVGGCYTDAAGLDDYPIIPPVWK